MRKAPAEEASPGCSQPLPASLAMQPHSRPALLLAPIRGRSILVAERVALNFLQRMSGIASLTRRMVDAVQVRAAPQLAACCTAPLDGAALLL